jgi:hypothetical protein
MVIQTPGSTQGGYRPDAPQNNFGISATGGAGSKDGQPNRYIPNMKSLGSTGVETMAQQGGAKLAKAEETPTFDMSSIRTLLDDTQNPMEPQSTGVNFGRGAGERVLPASLRSDERLIENKAIINKYMPSLIAAAQSPDAPDSYKQFLNFTIKEMQ